MLRAPQWARHALAGTLLSSAVWFAACSTTTTVVVVTATPDPATPTPDARMVAALAVVDQLTALETAALQIHGGMILMGDASASQVAFDTLVMGCQDFDTIRGSTDLWPTPYKDLRPSVSVFCLALDSYRTKHPAGDGQAWIDTLAFLRVSGTKVKTALDGLPDYSQAQLLRAVQERQ